MSKADSLTHPSPELTIRAIVTGMVLGALLTPCNVYTGLKIGWGFNMSVASGLLAFAFWRVGERLWSARHWGLLENNINQTSTSAATAIISAGLAAPIPALALLTGKELSWGYLSVWLLVVSLLGVFVAAVLRNQMLQRRSLAFPAGVATAETIRQIHAGGREAAGRLKILFGGIAVAGSLKLANALVLNLPRFSFPVSLPGGATLANLGIALDPSLLLVGYGAISGLRIGVSALIGALLAWGILGPLVLAWGWAVPGKGGPLASWFGPLVEWLLWPGATLMVVAALVNFAVLLFRARKRVVAEDNSSIDQPRAMQRKTFIAGLIGVVILVSAAQIGLFGIGLFEALVAVLLSFALAVVAGWVSGQTGITPVGALGKITQLSFGLLSPGNVTTNLMSANVTGGAAGQCADLLHDLKAGQIVGATPQFQIIAQLFGVLAGSLVGAAAYLFLIPDPQAMLLTPEWPAPAVATWKAVAEVLSGGLEAMPEGAVGAMIIAAIAGVALALGDVFLPGAVADRLPSPAAMGLAFVIPAWNSISLFLGALAGALIMKVAPDWARSRLIVLAAGLVVGESLAGVVSALWTIGR